jgi:4-amino-4-deoxy-L-arabinose transferase
MKFVFANVFLLTAILLATGNLWGPLETSEARYAEISREMLVSGDWIHPTLLNIYHYHKPPVTYWITAAAYYMLGITPFAFRFFLVVALVIQFFIVVEISKMLLNDKESARLAGYIYVTMPLVLASARGLTTDSYLMTFVLLSILCWIKLIEKQHVIFIYCCAISLGLAFLTKGPVALILPLTVILSLLKWRPLPPLKFWHWVLGLTIFLLISTSWFLILVYENKEFIHYFLFNHTIERITHAEVFSRSKPFYYYLLFLPVLALPWIVPFVFQLFKRTESRTIVKRIVLYWVGIPLLFFSAVSSKLPLYILPLFPGISIVTASYFTKNVLPRISIIFFVLNAIIGAALLYLALCIFNNELTWKVFFSAVFILGGSIIVYHVFSKNIALNALVLVLITGLLISSVFVFSSAYSYDVNTAALARLLVEKRKQKEPVLVFDELLPSLAFHLNEVPVSVYNGSKSLHREVAFQKDSLWKNYFVNFTSSNGKERFRQFINNSAVIVVQKNKYNHLVPYLSDSYKADSVGNRLIVYSVKK